MSRQIAKVLYQVRYVPCRLCGGQGRDPYSHGQSCRKCGGQKRVPTPAARKAEDAIAAYGRDLLASKSDGEAVTQDDYRNLAAFINGLRGATALVEYAD